MDYEMVLRHLKLTREHVATGERLLQNQQLLVEPLQRDGHDTSQASAILESFKEMQFMHIADVQRLENELAQNSDEQRRRLGSKVFGLT